MHDSIGHCDTGTMLQKPFHLLWHGAVTQLAWVKHIQDLVRVWACCARKTCHCHTVIRCPHWQLACSVRHLHNTAPCLCHVTGYPVCIHNPLRGGPMYPTPKSRYAAVEQMHPRPDMHHTVRVCAPGCCNANPHTLRCNMKENAHSLCTCSFIAPPQMELACPILQRQVPLQCTLLDWSRAANWQSHQHNQQLSVSAYVRTATTWCAHRRTTPCGGGSTIRLALHRQVVRGGQAHRRTSVVSVVHADIFPSKQAATVLHQLTHWLE